MNLKTRLAVLFYEVVILLFICFVSLFILHFIPFEVVQDILTVIYYEPKMRLLFGLISLLLLIKTHLMAQTIIGVQERGKNIAFDNPVGRVSVSLMAIEDLIRRVVGQLPEVKDARVSIVAGKKGLHVQTRLVLNGDINIPEMTSRIQKAIQHRIQDMIGLEETVAVEVAVVKIVPSADKSKRKKFDEPMEKDSSLPFEGYRA